MTGRMRALISAMCLVAVLATAASASASTAGEERAGEALARQLQAGATSCGRLNSDDHQRLGEFVMGRMAGTRHVAMHERMRSVMGAGNERRMHTSVGERYAGCATAGSGGPMMQPGTMMRGRGWSADGTWGPMMRSEAWAWMRDGAWQHMSRADWQRVSDQWMGPGMMGASSDDGWHASDFAFVALVVLLVAALVGTLAAWRPWRRRLAT